MRGRLAAWIGLLLGRACATAIIGASFAGLLMATAQAGSSTHSKTTHSEPQAEGGAASNNRSAPADGGEEQAKKTVKADPQADADAVAADAPAESSASPIGGAWETETLIRPKSPDEEITDQEALEIIERVNIYFNELRKLKADFLQTSANNDQKRGDFYFQRPGKVRFDYNRPSRLKIISDGEYLAVENHDLRTADRYSLDSTPFKLLLSEEVNLLKDANILAIDRGEDILILNLEDKTGQSPGQIRLFFKTDPELKLASWIITDARGVDTRIDLSNMERDVTLSAELFEFSEIGLPTFNR